MFVLHYDRNKEILIGACICVLISSQINSHTESLSSYLSFSFSSAAARALLADPSLSAEEVVRRSMEIAGDMCVYTNHNLIVENIPPALSSDTDAAASTEDDSEGEKEAK